MDEPYKPMLLKIELKSGETITGATIEAGAPMIQGFLAIEGNVVSTTRYIAIDAIESFSIINDEISNVLYLFPKPRIEVEKR